MIKFSVRNFQALGKADFQFDEGFTLITGPNDSGKTAVIRAWECLHLNPGWGASMIKHGTKGCDVLYEHGKNKIQWSRVKASGAYKINGVVDKKLGRSKLSDIAPNFKPLILGGNELANVIGEDSVLFPYSKTATELFLMFEGMWGVADTASILKAIKNDKTEVLFKERVATEELETLNKKIEDLKKVDLEAQVLELDRVYNDYKVVLKNVESIEEDQEIVSGIANWSKILTQLQKLEIPNPLDLDQLEELEKELIEVEQIKVFLTKVAELEDPPEPVKDYDLLFSSEKDLNQAGSLLKEVSRLQKILSFDIPEFDTDSIESFKDTDKSLKEAKKIQIDLDQLKKQKDLCMKHREEISIELSSYKVCPLCGSDLQDCKGLGKGMDL